MSLTSNQLEAILSPINGLRTVLTLEMDDWNFYLRVMILEEGRCVHMCVCARSRQLYSQGNL